MNLIKNPSELEVKQTMSAMIYGQPGIGKSTLACSSPNSVLFDYDGGVGRINGAHQVPTVQIGSWEETNAAIEEVKEAGVFQSIVIDTAGKMLSYMEDYIKRINPKMKKPDGTLSLQGYGLRKQMFIQFLKDVSLLNLNIIFVAHEVEQKRGDETVIRPEVGGSSANDLVKELDLVGYMEASGKERTICFDPAEKYYAKNTCNMSGVIKIPVTVDNNGNAVGENNFLCHVITGYKKRQASNIEMTSQYEELMSLIKGNLEEINNSDGANSFIDWIQSLTHIYNSKAVASKLLANKALELGLKFNKTESRYAS